MSIVVNLEPAEIEDDGAAGPAGSLADRAHGQLREAIAAHDLVPGQRLTERALALSLGMSPTPVREALRRLEQEGLVAKQGPRTITVVEHSPGRLEELQYASVVLRAAAAKFAAAKASDQQVAALRQHVAEMERAARLGASEDVLAAADRFDSLVEHIADNPTVAGLTSSIEVVGRARRLQAIDVMLRNRHDIGLRHLAAHRDLVDAIAAHDGDRAEDIVRSHLQSSMDLLRSGLDEVDGRRR